MAASMISDVLMPRGLDRDGQVAWWALGTIAAHNGNAPQHSWTPITTAELWTWEDDDWQQLADETPEISGPITDAQRSLIAADLVALERTDLIHDEPWWDR